MSKEFIEVEGAKAFVEANYQGNPLIKHMFGALLDKLPRAAEPRWIPVEEQLPPTIPCDAGTAYSEAVNILTAGRKVLTAIWDGEEFIADAEFWEAEGEAITHWTPVLLPLPKKEVE